MKFCTRVTLFTCWEVYAAHCAKNMEQSTLSAITENKHVEIKQQVKNTVMHNSTILGFPHGAIKQITE